MILRRPTWKPEGSSSDWTCSLSHDSGDLPALSLDRRACRQQGQPCTPSLLFHHFRLQPTSGQASGQPTDGARTSAGRKGCKPQGHLLSAVEIHVEFQWLEWNPWVRKDLEQRPPLMLISTNAQYNNKAALLKVWHVDSGLSSSFLKAIIVCNITEAL